MQEQHTRSTTALGAALTAAIASAETFVPKSTKNHAPRIPLVRTQTVAAPQASAQKDVTAKLRLPEVTLVFCGKFQKFVDAMNGEIRVGNECGGRTKSAPAVPALDSYSLATVEIDDLMRRAAVQSINVLVGCRKFYKVYVNCTVGAHDPGFNGWSAVYEKFIRRIAGLTYCEAKLRENDKTFLVLKEQSLRSAEVKIHFAIEKAK